MTIKKTDTAMHYAEGTEKSLAAMINTAEAVRHLFGTIVNVGNEQNPGNFDSVLKSIDSGDTDIEFVIRIGQGFAKEAMFFSAEGDDKTLMFDLIAHKKEKLNS